MKLLRWMTAAVLTGAGFVAVVELPASAAVPAPVVGSCHQYSWAAGGAASDTRPAVSCAGTYDARTDKVGYLPSSTTWSAATNPNSLVNHLANRNCESALIKAAGGVVRRDLHDYNQTVDFFPTQAQWAAGARWYRCDVILKGVQRLYPLPHAWPVLAMTYATSQCAQVASPSTWSPFADDTACLAPHNYRAVGVGFVAGASYPSFSTFQRVATHDCPAVAHTTPWIWDYPFQDDWAAGNHYVTCLAHTTH